jgi:hypothetical protein
MERRQRNNGLTMTTFHSRQSDWRRRVRKKANADTFNFTSQIPPPICAVMHTKHDKRSATIFKSLCKRTAVSKCFYRVEALPLVRTRFLRLANSSPKTARSPARRSRDSRATSGKTTGEISRVMSAQRPGNGRAVATAMPPNVRQDDSQDNLPCAGLGRAMSASDTGETTRNLSAQQSRNGQGNISQAARRISRRQFNRNVQKL